MKLAEAQHARADQLRRMAMDANKVNVLTHSRIPCRYLDCWQSGPQSDCLRCPYRGTRKEN